MRGRLNLKCPVCNNEMFTHSKKVNFFTLLIVGLIIWPMLLFLPFSGFIPVTHKCKTCKKVYKDKELKVTQ